MLFDYEFRIYWIEPALATSINLLFLPAKSWDWIYEAIWFEAYWDSGAFDIYWFLTNSWSDLID